MRVPRSGPLAVLLVALPLAALALASAWLAAPPMPQEAAPEDERRSARTPTGEPETLVYAALGDSITRAAGASGFGDSPAHSWATGNATAGVSVAERLRAAVAPRDVEALNAAVSGARIEDLPRQARLVAQADPDLVTVLVGANDACAAGPLHEEALARDVRDALAALPEDARVVVLGVPDVARLLELWARDVGALGSWAAFGTCPGILGTPDDAGRGAWSPPDLAAGRERVATVNRVLEEEATRAGAVWSDATVTPEFEPADVSTWDFFHPSAAGQARLAEVAWPEVARALALEARAEESPREEAATR